MRRTDIEVVWVVACGEESIHGCGSPNALVLQGRVVMFDRGELDFTIIAAVVTVSCVTPIHCR